MPEDIATQPPIEDCIMVGIPHRWLSLDGQDDRDDDSEDFSNRASASDYVEEDRARRSNAAAPSSSEDDDDPDASFDTLKNTTILKARFQLSPVRVKTVTGHRVCVPLFCVHCTVQSPAILTSLYKYFPARPLARKHAASRLASFSCPGILI